MPRIVDPDEIELAVGPHVARREWNVLRVTYRRCPDHERRVAAAVSTLLVRAPQPSGGEGAEPAPAGAEEAAGREA